MGMSYLIDTHIFLWWLLDDPKLDNLPRHYSQPRLSHFGSSVFPLGKFLPNTASVNYLKPNNSLSNIHRYYIRLNLSNLPSPQPMHSEREVYQLPIEIPLIA